MPCFLKQTEQPYRPRYNEIRNKHTRELAARGTISVRFFGTISRNPYIAVVFAAYRGTGYALKGTAQVPF